MATDSNIIFQETEGQRNLKEFWDQILQEMSELDPHDLGIQKIHFKSPELPLARIKKIMKLDDDVKMISAEAPVLFSKAAECFIRELTLRAWIHTEENKRRTLQKNDVSLAISKCDTFDFLIDIVPREDGKQKEEATATPKNEMQYYLVPQQQQQSQHQNMTQPIQIHIGNNQEILQLQSPHGSQITSDQLQQLQVQLKGQTNNHNLQQIQVQIAGNDGTPQIIHVPVSSTGSNSVVQQIMMQSNSNNDSNHIQAITLTPEQLQSLQLKTGQHIQTGNNQMFQIQQVNVAGQPTLYLQQESSDDLD